MVNSSHLSRNEYLADRTTSWLVLNWRKYFTFNYFSIINWCNSEKYVFKSSIKKCAHFQPWQLYEWKLLHLMIVKSHNWTQSWHSKCAQIAWTRMQEQSSDVDERERVGECKNGAGEWNLIPNILPPKTGAICFLCVCMCRSMTLFMEYIFWQFLVFDQKISESLV